MLRIGDETEMRVVLIRHGQTAANRERRFLGLTDQPLTEESRRELAVRSYPQVEQVFSSPLLRCRQTAEIIYPALGYSVVTDLREMDFGLFEGKTNEELSREPFYREWLAAGRADFPGGETMAEFSGRCLSAFRAAAGRVQDDGSAAFIIHGGVIMALMSGLGQGDFYDFLCGNGAGFVCRWQEGRLYLEEKLCWD